MRSVPPNIEAHNYGADCTTALNYLDKLPQLRTWSADVEGMIVITSEGND